MKSERITEEALLAEIASLQARMDAAEESLGEFHGGFAKAARRALGRRKEIEEMTRFHAAADHQMAEIVQGMTEACFALDRDWCFTFVNDRCQSLFHYNRDEMLGRAFWDVFRKLVGTPTERQYRRAMSRRVPVSFETYSPIAERWIDVRLFPSGNGLAAFVLDIHERKMVEKALRESEEKLRFALETIHTGAWDLDLDGQSAFRSTEHDLIFGYGGLQPEWTYEKFLGHVLPEDRAAVDRQFQAAANNHGDWNFECRIRRTDGEIRWIWAAGRHRQDGGETSGHMTGIVQDITERKCAEATLRESERCQRERAAELAALLDAMPAPVLIAHDPACRHITGNRAGDELLHIPRGGEASLTAPGATRPRNFRCLRDGRELSNDELPVQRAARGFPVDDFDFTLAFDDGTTRDVLSYGTTLWDDHGQPRGAVLVLIDMTERKRLEREILEISECEQSRLGQDLHDGLGQELTGISMLCTALASDLQAGAHPASTLAANIATYINDTIASARRLARGLYPVELTRHGLFVALRELADQTNERLGISCNLNQTGEESAFGKSVEIHIYRIVQECIANAIKHGRAGYIVIESRAEEGFHTFSVADDGIGFTKAEVTSGMGLHLMDYRARLIGAEIHVEKPAQGGCRVSFRLPA